MGLVTPRHVESSWTRYQTCVACIGLWILIHCATREVPTEHLKCLGPTLECLIAFVWGRAQKSGLVQTSPAYSKLKPELMHLLGWSPAAQGGWHHLGLLGMQTFRPTPDLLQGQSLHHNRIPQGAPMPTEGRAALG